MASIPWGPLFFGPLDPTGQTNSDRPVGGPIGRPTGNSSPTGPAGTAVGPGGGTARSYNRHTEGTARGQVDPNRSSRAVGYKTYSGTGPLQGAAVPGTGFPNQGAKEAAQEQQIAPMGTQSGPGILESWFNQRATGTDPAFEYAMNRGMEGLGNRYAASGAFNSGAARQQESDLMANLISQRMGQLDALAGGASGEHQGRLNAMFSQGLGLAQGQSGLSSAYDLGAAGNMDAANRAQTQMNLLKTGVDAQGNQGAINNIMAFWGMGQGGKNASG